LTFAPPDPFSLFTFSSYFPFTFSFHFFSLSFHLPCTFSLLFHFLFSFSFSYFSFLLLFLSFSFRRGVFAPFLRPLHLTDREILALAEHYIGHASCGLNEYISHLFWTVSLQSNWQELFLYDILFISNNMSWHKLDMITNFPSFSFLVFVGFFWFRCLFIHFFGFVVVHLVENSKLLVKYWVL